MKFFFPYQKLNADTLIKWRQGETKLGEVLAEHWQHPSVKYVLLGIEEDIGVRVNGGIGGTDTAWQSFLSAFLNIQNTPFLRGNGIGIYGHFNFEGLKNEVNSKTVEQIDAAVCSAIREIVAAGKLPVVIGGGHNNAYPILKGVSEVIGQPINAVNLDAHSDFRMQEGRHSGNGFRYAYTEGVLKRYAIVGLHQNYNSELIINELVANSDIWFCFWEDIFLWEKLGFKQAIDHAIGFTKNTKTGIELDLDSVENILSSAMTPSGVSATQARQYVHQMASKTDVAYLHICEGASQLATGQTQPLLGKFLSYLVSDFMKASGTK
jgi:formiminoglutamase